MKNMKGGVVMRGLKNVVFGVLAVGLLAAPMMASAIVTPTAAPNLGDPVTLTTIENIILRIITFLVTFGIIIAVGMIILGGIRWMAAAGNDEKAEGAKKMIKNGIYGAAIVLGVGVILRTVASLINLDFFNL
ncbi:MAG: hypothetical protein AAB479_02635 [Patescibacteria group bacterium]